MNQNPQQIENLSNSLDKDMYPELSHAQPRYDYAGRQFRAPENQNRDLGTSIQTWRRWRGAVGRGRDNRLSGITWGDGEEAKEAKEKDKDKDKDKNEDSSTLDSLLKTKPKSELNVTRDDIGERDDDMLKELKRALPEDTREERKETVKGWEGTLVFRPAGERGCGRGESGEDNEMLKRRKRDDGV